MASRKQSIRRGTVRQEYERRVPAGYEMAAEDGGAREWRELEENWPGGGRLQGTLIRQVLLVNTWWAGVSGSAVWKSGESVADAVIWAVPTGALRRTHSQLCGEPARKPGYDCSGD